MTGTMTWVGFDVHARSTHAAAIDTMSGELTRLRFGPGIEGPVAWLSELPGPVSACYEAGPTGFGLYRAAAAAGIGMQVIAPGKTPRGPSERVKTGPPQPPTDLSPQPHRSGGRGARPSAAGTRDSAMGSALDQSALRPLLDSASRRHETGPWGHQSPHHQTGNADTEPGVPVSRPLPHRRPSSRRDHALPLDKPHAISADGASSTEFCARASPLRSTRSPNQTTRPFGANESRPTVLRSHSASISFVTTDAQQPLS